MKLNKLVNSVLEEGEIFRDDERALSRRKFISGLGLTAAGITATNIQYGGDSGEDALNYVENRSNTEKIDEVEFSYDGDELTISDDAKGTQSIQVVEYGSEGGKSWNWELKNSSFQIEGDEDLYIQVYDEDKSIPVGSAIFEPGEGVDQYNGRVHEGFIEKERL